MRSPNQGQTTFVPENFRVLNSGTRLCMNQRSRSAPLTIMCQKQMNESCLAGSPIRSSGAGNWFVPVLPHQLTRMFLSCANCFYSSFRIRSQRLCCGQLCTNSCFQGAAKNRRKRLANLSTPTHVISVIGPFEGYMLAGHSDNKQHGAGDQR